MKPGFAETLSALRREKNLSQKKAADDLGISQALLSHYENGLREPKLEFIVRASTYYGVTTDYLLGLARERESGGAAAFCRMTADERRCADAMAVILSVLAEIGDKQLCRSALRYFGFVLHGAIVALGAPARPHEPLFEAALKVAEAEFLANVQRVRQDLSVAEALTGEALKRRYPERYKAVAELEEMVEKAMAALRQPAESD